ncbi:MAG: ABC transporter ATP-binding protein, partial [Pyrodictiaceae archaeon]
KPLLMDEPSQGLAPIIVEEPFKTIARLKEENYSILLVKQNARKALEVADRVYLLDTGRIVYSATARKAMEDPGIRKAYLGNS